MLLTSEQRMRAVVWSEDGVSQTEIARRLNCNQSTISRLLRNYAATGSTQRLHGSGRPRLSSPANDAALVRYSLRHRHHTARQLREVWQSRGVIASTRTVQRRLVAAGLFARVAIPRPVLTPSQQEARLRFALAHRRWTPANFANVLFTDEAPFFVGSSGGRTLVRLRRGERGIPEARTVPRQRRPGPHVMVWGAIRRSGVGPLIRIEGTLTANRYLRLVEDALLQIPMGPGFIWMHDNAPAHRAQSVHEHFADHQIRLLRWPSNSPDLNPIENMWGFIVQNMPRNGITTADQLWHRLQQFWAAIPAQHVQNLIDSMPRRLRQVIDRNGGQTDY